MWTIPKGSAWFSRYTSCVWTWPLPPTPTSLTARMWGLLELSCTSLVTATAPGQGWDWGCLPPPALHRTGACPKGVLGSCVERWRVANSQKCRHLLETLSADGRFPQCQWPQLSLGALCEDGRLWSEGPASAHSVTPLRALSQNKHVGLMGQRQVSLQGTLRVEKDGEPEVWWWRRKARLWADSQGQRGSTAPRPPTGDGEVSQALSSVHRNLSHQNR